MPREDGVGVDIEVRLWFNKHFIVDLSVHLEIALYIFLEMLLD